MTADVRPDLAAIQSPADSHGLPSSPACEGLSSAEAAARLASQGPNAIREERPRAWLGLARKLWGPVPWMLEACLVLEVVLGHATQGVIIGLLVVVNAVLSYSQESRAQAALALLRKSVALFARARRDGTWTRVPAADVVPGDVLRLRLGDLVPADARILEGGLLLDQSALTGEALPVEGAVGKTVYSGSVVKRGEATVEVTATGSRTFFGKTAELVRIAGARSHIEEVVVGVVKYLLVLDAVLAALVLAYALWTRMPLADVLPFVLILLVASVPVALPATFALATAYGSLALAKVGVLVTRLSAIEDAAAMDVLISDKTGTITKNELAVVGIHPSPSRGDTEVLRLAALACEEASQDPIDLAILVAARARGALDGLPARERFLPFDTQTKRSEAWYREAGLVQRVVKGAPSSIAALVGERGDPEGVEQLAARGCRVLGVAAGPEGKLAWVGLLGLEDPPRFDSHEIVQRLHALGIRVVMATGDGPATASHVARQVGIGVHAITADALRGEVKAATLERNVFAGVFPEDKFHLGQAFQRAGHVVGMTGDGVNDAPALKQAEVGIAVSNATDVAKAAASVVLTSPGLGHIPVAIEVGRAIYQRMLTYTLNKIVKTFQVALFLSLGLVLTGAFVTTPRHILLLLFANDVVTMSLATDSVRYSRRPDRWRIGAIVAGASVLAVCWLAFAFGTFFVGRDVLHLELPALQTLSFLMLVFTGQATVYLARERDHFWRSRPSRWMLLGTIFDVIAVSALATLGILVDPVPAPVVLGLLAAVLASFVFVDLAKVAVWRRLAFA